MENAAHRAAAKVIASPLTEPAQPATLTSGRNGLSKKLNAWSSTPKKKTCHPALITSRRLAPGLQHRDPPVLLAKSLNRWCLTPTPWKSQAPFFGAALMFEEGGQPDQLSAKRLRDYPFLYHV